MKKNLNFNILDVFAENKYEGNQLAVFRNAWHLTDEQMLKIAREINFQESTFILSEKESNGGFDVKIFTPEYEVPFAGHPTLGTAFVIKRYLQVADNQTVILNLKIGQVPVFEEDEVLWLEISNPTFGMQFKADDIGYLFDLAPDMLADDLPIEIVSTGLPYLIVPMKSIEAVQSIHFEETETKNWLIDNHFYKENSIDGLTLSFFVFTKETVDSENDFHARMFCYENGKIIEDAATGSANSCLLAYLMKNSEIYKDKSKSGLNVEQGYEMNRKSLIRLRGEIDENNRFKLQIGGKVKSIASGIWEL
jgi:trans-2,3-dihydro-3-hydroxyanthranilate isomerase